MWFNILKLDLSRLSPEIQVDADAKAINIQRPNKCKEKLLKIIEIMKDADKKAREALPNALEFVLQDSVYKNRDGETIKFKVGDWRDGKRVFAEKAPYRFGFEINSDMRNLDRFKEIDEMLACQLLEALKVALADYNTSKIKRIDNSEGKEIGLVKYTFYTGNDDIVTNKLEIFDTSQYYNVVSISYGGTGYPYSRETFEGYEEFEKDLVNKLFTDVYSPAFKKIEGML